MAGMGRSKSRGLPQHVRIGEVVKRAREKAEMSRPELAEHLGVDPSIVSRIESGDLVLSLERAVEIARILGISVTRLSAAVAA